MTGNINCQGTVVFHYPGDSGLGNSQFSSTFSERLTSQICSWNPCRSPDKFSHVFPNCGPASHDSSFYRKDQQDNVSVGLM